MAQPRHMVPHRPCQACPFFTEIPGVATVDQLCIIRLLGRCWGQTRRHLYVLVQLTGFCHTVSLTYIIFSTVI
jgi:hypothetical protein